MVIIPYTMVKFVAGRGKPKEICVDSFALAHISDIVRYPLVTYLCKTIRKFRMEYQSITYDLGIKMLRREIPSYEILRRVVEIYRKLSYEISELRRNLNLSPTHSLMFWLSPVKVEGKNDEMLIRFTRLAMSGLLFESLLGKELLMEDPTIETLEEFNIGLPLEVQPNSVKFVGKDIVIKIYNKLLANDEGYKKALLREIYI